MRRKNRKRNRPKRSRTLQRFAVPFAYVCLFAQLSCIAHFAFVQHGICPEHGEVIDVHRDHAAAHAALAKPAPKTSALASVSRTTGDPSGDDHDHCILVHEQRSQHRAPSTPVASATASLQLPPIHAERSPLGSLVVYALAPKNSPPASRHQHT